jgi:hypothetical protein
MHPGCTSEAANTRERRVSRYTFAFLLRRVERVVCHPPKVAVTGATHVPSAAGSLRVCARAPATWRHAGRAAWMLAMRR